MSMKRTPTVCLLLVAIALVASAGPHPCHAMQPASPVKAVAGHAACHGTDHTPKAPPRGNDCCDPVKGRHLLCEAACQGMAVFGVAPGVSVQGSFDELTAVLQVRAASSFVFSIDHVPLA